MGAPKVLYPVASLSNEEYPDHIPEFRQFEKDFNVVYKSFDQPFEDIKELFRTGDLNDVEAIWLTGAVIRLQYPFNDLIDYFPETLRVIALPWVGHDRIDGAKLRSRGIHLVNIGDAPSKDVADIALQLTLGTFRYTHFFERKLRESNGSIAKAREVIGGTDVDTKTREPLPPTDPKRKNYTKYVTVGGKALNSPAGKVAGIVGLGSIGKEIAIRLWAIGMEISYTKRTPLKNGELSGLPYKPTYFNSFEELIPHVDLLILAVPHSSETTHLINKDTIKLFKRGARVVNIGRGSAIDEDVLLKALDDGTINSAGLDVFQNEPNIDPRFVNRHDVTILPHLGSFTEDNFRDSTLRTIENIRDVLVNGGQGIHLVN